MDPYKFIKPVIIVTITLLLLNNSFTPILVPGTATAVDSPLITIKNPTEGQALNKTSFSISGSIETTVSADVYSVDVYIDKTLSAKTSPDANGNWSIGVNNVTEGSHTVYATAKDSQGNTGVSSIVTFEVDITPPELIITSPLQGAYINLPLIEGRTEPDTRVTIFVYGKEASVTSDLLGNWFYFDDTLPEGNHNVYATAADKAGNVTTTLSNSFVLDMTRPVILPDIFPGEDMTQVPLTTVARVYLVESSPVTLDDLQSSLLISEKGNPDGNVNGTVYSAVYTTVNGDQYYELIFQPQEALKPYTKYLVSINPMLQDAAGNLVSPRTWEFQTTGEVLNENPHGNFTDNVNTCINCHRTHRAGDSKLSESIDPTSVKIDDYCIACHDGTSAPIPDNWNKGVNHDFQMTIEGTAGPSSCASCHNPHLTLTTDNPNLIKDYYSYSHNDPTNPYLPDTSEQELCEACHPSAVKDDSRVSYVMYNYRKWHTATGVNEDYSLCLRCHDGQQAVDVASYYGQPSGHTLQALDGSYLNGNIPCADCHNTHGSSNLRVLREELGHNKVRQFQSVGETWDPANERRFCTGCHNNETELYGIVAGFVYNIPGHEDTNTQYCSACHGGTPEAAAHAPK